jgi:acetyl-CoA acetyltransferase
MGIEPVLAISASLEKCGLEMDDIDVFEINVAAVSPSHSLRQ